MIGERSRDNDMTNIFYNNWTTQLRKGLLDLCILNAIARGRLYGYDIVRQLRQVEGLVISEGTVYPILSRLHRDGMVETSLEESSEGPARKYYLLSQSGQELLERMNRLWTVILEGVRKIQSRKGTEQ
jgi:PadR family transcriptional regulator PadR